MTILSSSVFQEQETRGSNVSDSSDPRIQKMMESIIQEPRAFFKNQSRDEDDLTLDEKEGIARRLLVEKPDVFLTRYSPFIPSDCLSFFEDRSSANNKNYVLERILKELSFKNKKYIKNRRWAAWNRMLESNDPYVSRECMKARYPALYERYFGEGIIQREISAKKPGSDCTLSGMIMEHAELQNARELLKTQKAKEKEKEDDVEEYDTDEDDEVVNEEDSYGDPCEEWKDAVCQRFLQGLDKNFDYAAVDGEEDYDDLKIRERDEEEEYFND